MFYSFELEKIPTIQKFYSVVRNTVWSITDHDNILIIITNGKCRIDSDGESYLLCPGDVFFVPSEHSYERRPIDGELCTMHYIHFSTSSEITQLEPHELLDELNRTYKKIDDELLDGDPVLSYPSRIYIGNKTSLTDKNTLKMINEMLYGIAKLSSGRKLMCNLQSCINLCTILSLISQTTIDSVAAWRNVHTESGVPQKLKKAVSYISRHYSEQISLTDLAAHCNVSKQQLIRYFKHYFGTTPISYINEYKLARAKELLFNSPNLLISEIASELGFGNQYYFTKLFTKHTGETPSHYRYRTHNYKEQN